MKVHPKLKFLERCFPEYPMPELKFKRIKNAGGYYVHPDRAYPTGCIVVNIDKDNTANDEAATIAHEFAHHIQWCQGKRQDTSFNYWLIEQGLEDKLTWDEMESLYFQIPLERAAELFAWLMTGNEHSWRRLVLSGINVPKKVPRSKKTIDKYRRLVDESL